MNTTPQRQSAGIKRKQVSLLSFDKVKELITSVNIDDPGKGVEEIRTVWKALQDLISAVDSDPPRKQRKEKSDCIQASLIKDVETAVKLFGLDYNAGLEDYAWEMGLDQPKVVVADWLVTVLKLLRSSPFWHLESSQALHRTSIDLTLFERLSAHQAEVGARRLCLKAERAVTAQCPGGKYVSGDIDYVFGYEHAEGKAQFESNIIVVEAKKKSTFESGIGQVVCYMVGIQQHQQALNDPKRIVTTVYGMVSDGFSWQFLRLDAEKRLLISAKLTLSFAQQAAQVYQFIDSIIRAGIAASPHTTPQNRFPSTGERWAKSVEADIFGISTGLQSHQQILGKPLREYLIDVDIEDDGLEGVEEFLVVREGTPTPCNVKVDGVSPRSDSPFPN